MKYRNVTAYIPVTVCQLQGLYLIQLSCEQNVTKCSIIL